MRWIAAVITLVVFGAACGDDAGSGPASAAALANVIEYPAESRNHVLDDVAYENRPPTGGDHFGFWQNCGFYTSPVIDEVAVHSLEHGAVWAAYAPSTDGSMLAAVAERANDESHLLASPYPALESGIVLTAWERQLTVQSWDDPSVEAFLDRYLGRRSPTAPEAGASCSGAIGEPPADPDRRYDEARADIEAAS